MAPDFRGLTVRDLVIAPGASPITQAIAPGEIVGLAGLDGHGQELFLKMLAGLVPPLGGSIEIGMPGAPRKITGFRLGETKPKRVWRNELEAGAKLADIAREKGKDPDALWDTKLVGSTKVHELLGRSKPVKDLVDSLLFTPDGKPAMVEDWAPVPQVARPAKVA